MIQTDLGLVDYSSSDDSEEIDVETFDVNPEEEEGETGNIPNDVNAYYNMVDEDMEYPSTRDHKGCIQTTCK